MALPDNIVIGATYRFDYPKHFVTLPELTARTMHECVVVRQLTQDEADQADDMERMFEIRFVDGFIAQAWASELVERRTTE